MGEQEKNQLVKNQNTKEQLPETVFEKNEATNLNWLYCLLTGFVSGLVSYQAGKHVGKKQAEKEFEAELQAVRKKYRTLKDDVKKQELKKFEL